MSLYDYIPNLARPRKKIIETLDVIQRLTVQGNCFNLEWILLSKEDLRVQRTGTKRIHCCSSQVRP